MRNCAAQSETTRQTKLLAVYLAFTGLLTIKYALRRTIDHDPWTIGDWLINYSACVIRRGLPGSVFLFSGHLTHLPLNWLVFVFTVSLYVCYLINVYVLARPLQWTWGMWALVLASHIRIFGS